MTTYKQTTTKTKKQEWEKKQLEWIFQATNRRNLAREDLDKATKGKLPKETESLLKCCIVTIMTNYTNT